MPMAKNSGRTVFGVRIGLNFLGQLNLGGVVVASLTAMPLIAVVGKQYLGGEHDSQPSIHSIPSSAKDSSLAGLLLFVFVLSPCKFGSWELMESSWTIPG